MPDDPQSASAYAGRWVARVRERIVAQGGTPEQALHAAQRMRHKEKLEIIYMPAPFSHSPLIDRVREALPNQEVHLVGGAVRDMLRNRLSHDLDFALPANGITLARTVANALHADFMPLDEERDTGRVIVIEADNSRTYLDFATYRGGSTLEADLRARDFTINAIAYNIHNNTIIDPLNGATDLRGKLIRACSPSALTDDPIRILRAIRQAAAFEFKIETGTRQTMKAAAHLLPNISAERQRDELFKILEGPRPDASLRALEMLGIFPHMLPELSAMKGCLQSPPHVYEVWEHTLSVLRHLEGVLTALRVGYSAEETNDMLTGLLTLRLGRYREQFATHFAQPLNTDRSARAALFFATLYHDVQKPATRSVEEVTGRIRFFEHEERGAEVAAQRGQDFNLSNDEIDRIQKIVLHHMRFHTFTSRMLEHNEEPSRKAIYRYFRDAGTAGIDLVLLGLADLRGTYDHTLTQETWVAALDVARILLENYFERREETVAPPRLLDGNDLMKELNLQPGRIIGQLLESIREGQAGGEIMTREQALEHAQIWLLEHQKFSDS